MLDHFNEFSSDWRTDVDTRACTRKAFFLSSPSLSLFLSLFIAQFGRRLFLLPRPNTEKKNTKNFNFGFDKSPMSDDLHYTILCTKRSSRTAVTFSLSSSDL